MDDFKILIESLNSIHPFIYLIWFGVISLFTAIVTAYDKYAAQKGKWRISEAALFTLAFLGGSLAEYLIMKKIRHKTKHLSFMIGLPIIIIFQIFILILLFFI